MCDPLFPSVLVKTSVLRSFGRVLCRKLHCWTSMARRRWAPRSPDIFVLHNSVRITGGTGHTLARNFAPDRNDARLENRIFIPGWDGAKRSVTAM